MAKPSARVICDSIGPHGIRLTTMELTGWLPTHAEFMTHRAFSRNAASNRAIPATKMREQVISDPFLPLYWMSNQSGMQGYTPLDSHGKRFAKLAWDNVQRMALGMHESLTGEGINLHKQTANRLLMPFLPMLKVVTGIESAWANYFHLRCHHAAQQEEAVQAFRAADAYFGSVPMRLQPGEWHLPYILPWEINSLPIENLIRSASARCARVSYVRQNEVDYVAEGRIYERLRNPSTPREYDPDEPLHGSPLEHVAECLEEAEPSGNFVGWRQHRKQIPNEMRTTFSKADLEQRRRDWIERFGELG